MARRNQRSPKWAFLKILNIPDRDDPTQLQMRRLRIVDCPLFGIYIHWIKQPDSALDPHDHPWTFWSIVLRGGCTEEVHTTIENLGAWMSCRRRWLSMRRFPLDRAHHISEVKPNTMTLVVRGPRRKSWGFWTGSNRIVDWSRYLDATPDPFDMPN